MTNNYGIPDWLEKKVRERDKFCIYCHVEMKEYPHVRGTPKDKATIEHIDNDVNHISEENIAMCCASCNASKGKKPLSEWFDSEYCKKRGISKEKVADVVRKHIENEERNK